MKEVSSFFGSFNNKSAFIFFVGFSLLFFLVNGNNRYKFDAFQNSTNYCVKSDGGGYYAYLPQIFIYKTSNFEFTDKIEKKYRSGDFFQYFLPLKGKKKIDKYFIGTSVCIGPFFIVNHFLTSFFGGDADGYSWSYQFSVFLAAINFWLLGVISLHKLLHLYQVSNNAIIFSLVGLTFGTNLIQYILIFPSLSHIYSFGLISFFLLKLKIYISDNQKRNLIWLFALLGLITIIRPVNFLIILIIPFFFSSLSQFWQQLKFAFKYQFLTILFGLSIFLFFIFLQFLNIHSQLGFWGFNSYIDEGFDYITNPKIPEVLFGFRKGLFIYSPFLLLIFPGLFYIFKDKKNAFFWFLMFSLIYVYVISSWHCWYYGGFLGMRGLIDIIPILIFPIAILFDNAKIFSRIFLVIFSFVMIKFNFLLQEQYGKSIIDRKDMNKELFFQVFLQKGNRFSCIVDNKSPMFELKKYQLKSIFFFRSYKEEWTKVDKHSNQIFKNGVNSLVFMPDSTFLQSNVAVQLNFLEKLNSERSAPKAQLFGYKNNEKEEISVDFFGSRIPSLNRFYPIDARLTSKLKYSNFDSLEVFLDNDKGKIKNLSCKIFVSKK